MMLSKYNIIRGAFTPLYRQAILVARRAKASGSSESDDGKKDDETSLTCPCSACSSDFNPSTPTIYNSRKYGHSLPSNDIQPPFDPIPNVPTGIFRCTVGEVLGKGADKCGIYQCPEYFSYQHMTYYDMHLILRAVRSPRGNTERKP